MGCSPSKGHRWNDAMSPISDSEVQKAGPVEFDRNLQSDDRGCSVSVSQIEADGGERASMVQKDASIVPQEERRLSHAEVASGVDTVLGNVSTHKIEVNVVPREKETQNLSSEDNQGKTMGSRPRRNKGGRQSRQKDKDKKAFINGQKVDFPESMVKAHQAAYAYLNPNVSKYEALLGLLDQAAHTQLSLQPMVAFMVLRYEEVTHSLEEMATEGEQLLKEHRDHLAWPCPMMDRCSTASAKPENQPPDLMQQLLQYSTERMRQVGDSVGGLGDSALEEASDYFFSLAELLDDKQKAKKVAEVRLSQVIAHFEAAAYRKSSPADSALQSEDSGIGADNESLAGSEKHRHRRESCESAGNSRAKSSSQPCNRFSLIQQGEMKSRQVGKVSTNLSQNSPESPYADNEQTGTDYPQGSEDDEDENEDDDDEEEGEKKRRQRSNSSPPDPSQLTRRLATTRIENPQNVELTFKMKDAISGRIRFDPSQRIMRSRRANDIEVGSPQWTEDEDWQARRPQTAGATFNVTRRNPSTGRQQRSRSAESLHSQAEDPTILQLERTQRDLSCRIERMNKGKPGRGPKATAILSLERGRPEEIRKFLHPQPPLSNRLRSSLDRNFTILPNHDRTGLRADPSRDKLVGKGEKVEEKQKDIIGRGQLRVSIQPSPPVLSKAELPKLHRGRNSVKSLINTFSQKNDKEHRGPSNIHGSFRETRTCGGPTTLNTGNGNTVLMVNGNNNNNSCQVDPRASNRPEDLDVDSLPPPPPEVLMDNSFECVPVRVSESGDTMSGNGYSPVPQRNVLSQRERASLPSVTALPSHVGPRRSSLSLSPTCPTRKDAVVGYQNGDDAFQFEVDAKSEETATLYRQARKIIHLRHATDSAVKKTLVDVGPKTASVSIGNNVSSEIKSTCSYPNIQPPTTPPVSRARMPPCTPSNWKFPNPPPFRCQPTPPSPDKLPTSPVGQLRHLSHLKLRQEETLASTLDSCSLKANSPLPSPQVERWTRPSSPSQSFNDARSAFSHTLPSLSEPPTWASSGSCALPQPWGMPSCRKLPVSMRGPQPFVKQNQFDSQPSITLPSHQPGKPIATVKQSCGKDLVISSQKLDLRPSSEDDPLDTQSDLTDTNHSASKTQNCAP